MRMRSLLFGSDSIIQFQDGRSVELAENLGFSLQPSLVLSAREICFWCAEE